MIDGKDEIQLVDALDRIQIHLAKYNDGTYSEGLVHEYYG